jgi:hypothetical protein
MTSMRLVIRWWILAGLIVGVLGFLVFSQHREIALLRQSEVARAEAADKAMAAMRGELAVAKAAVHSAGVDHAAVTAPQVAAVGPSRETPDHAKMRRELSRLKMIGRFADVFAALNITPEKRDALKDLLLEKYTTSADARNAAQQLGIQMDTHEMYAAVGAATAPADAAIKSLLSDDEYQSYSSLMDQHLVNSYRPDTLGASGSLIDAGVPLTPDQATSLARVYYQLEEASFEGSLPGDLPDPASGLSPAQQYVLDHAAQSLSPGQITALRNYFVIVVNPSKAAAQ